MWQPTADLKTLQLRAQILTKIRAFFAVRGILEIDTPLLSHSTVTDPQLHSFITHYFPAPNAAAVPLYLQTSPEFAMKRLLAAGSGAIYQICKAFRNSEAGRWHNPEFTMLEWYRPGFDQHQLMNEVDEFLQDILQTSAAERATYAEIFQRYCGLDPHTATLSELKKNAAKFAIEFTAANDTSDRDLWLQLIMTHVIEPQLGFQAPVFIYDYPASQAALAKIRQEKNVAVAERFEVYINGIELANGFHELTDANEQRARFVADLQTRTELKLPLIPLDENFLQALSHGLPPCAGVALGIDRLIILAADANNIAQVLSFTVDNA